MSHMRKQVQQLFYVCSKQCYSPHVLYEPCLLKEAQNQNDMTLVMLWYARRKVACCYRKSSEKNSCRLSKQKQ